MVLGKILGSSTLAWLQSVIFLAFLPLTGYAVTALALLELIGALFLIAFAFTSLGFLIAWRMESTQGFHAVVNLVLFPLWMVSGSLFSIDSAHSWMQWLMRLNPLTYSVAAVRGLLEPASPAIPALRVSLAVTLSFALILWLLSTLIASRPARESHA
jgi:ABC-2 type transport system permease protein